MVFDTTYETDRFTVYKGDTIKEDVSLVVQLLDDFTKKEAIGWMKVKIDPGNIEPIKNPSRYYVFTGLEEALEEPSYKVKISSEFYFPQEKEIKRQEIRTSDIQLKFGNKGPTSCDTSIKLKDVSQVKIGDLVEFHSHTGDIEQKEITAINSCKGEISWAGELKFNFNASDDYVIALKNPVISFFLKPLPSYPFGSYVTLIRGTVKYPDKIPCTENSVENSVENPVAGATVKIPALNMETESDEKGEFVLYFNEIKNEKISIEITKDEAGREPVSLKKDTTLKEGVMKALGIIILR